MAFRSSPADQADGPSLAVLLGIAGNGEDDAHACDDLAQVAAAWPMVALVQAVAVIAAVIVEGGSLLSIALALAIASASSLGFAVARTRSDAMPPHRRAMFLSIAAAVVAGGLLSLIWNTAEASDHAAHFGATVLLAGAAGLSGLALHAVRAAILSYGIGLVCTMAALVSAPLVVAEAGSLLAALAFTTVRLARNDYAVRRALAERSSAGDQAVRMVTEFEANGTGWFWETDRNGNIVYMSRTVAAELTAYDADPIGRPLAEVFRMESATRGTERTLTFHMASRTPFTDYSVCASSDVDGARWWSMTGRPVIDPLGRFRGFVGSGADLTERRRSEAEIKRLALTDSLTGLANRQRMRLALEKVMAQVAGQNRPAALFLLDLDRFKAVNDTLGHQAGDSLLRQVAARLLEGVGEAGLVGRLGGDEFQVLLPLHDNRDVLAALARKLIEEICRPYWIGETQVTIGTSIGIALAPVDGDDAETLIRHADLALYAAKGAGRGVHRFYAAEMLAGAMHRQQLETDLRAGIGKGEFHLCYQAIVDAQDARIIGYEALVRWQHPVRGLVPPADFVSVAEDCGLIEALGEWVLRTACREAAAWPGGVRVAVNVSPIQFANADLPLIVANALAESGLAPERLELELTEGVFLHDPSTTLQRFHALKRLGVRLVLDDFGTGYSSLARLRSAPFDKIKIDRSFVGGIARPESGNAAIVKAIITLADTLGMETTAEGVEMQDEIEPVLALGCRQIQGFVYGRPARAEAVQAALVAGDGYATPVGFRVSRSQRAHLLRSIRLFANGRRRDARVRNVSAHGAMIDGVHLNDAAVGLDVLVELVEDRMVPAEIRWAQDGRIGLRFPESVDVPALAGARADGSLRKAG